MLSVAEAKQACTDCERAIAKLIRDFDQALVDSGLQVEDVRIDTDHIEFIGPIGRPVTNPRVRIVLGVTK